MMLWMCIAKLEVGVLITRLTTFCAGMLVGLCIALPLYAQVSISWNKPDVTPTVTVKPAIGGFVPVDGSAK